MAKKISPIKKFKSMKSDSFFSDDEELQGLNLFDKLEHKRTKHSNINVNEYFNLKPMPKKENVGFNELDIEFERMNVETKFETKISSNTKNKNNSISDNNSIHNNYDEKNFLVAYENLDINNSGHDNNNKEKPTKLDELTKIGEINININNNNQKYSKNILLGRKRILEKTDIKTKEDIYKEIKILFDKYNQNYPEFDEILPSYKIYEVSKGIFEKNATIIQKAVPGCILYFYKNIIKSIYLIREEKVLTETDEIVKILEYIRDKMTIIS